MNVVGRGRSLVGLVLAVALLAASACTSEQRPEADPGAPAPAATTARTSTPGAAAAISDPFEYCARVGTIDAPDARYGGEPVPSSIVEGVREVAGATAMPLEVLIRGTSWRCMDGKVYACVVGANLPCGEKADTGRAPSSAITEFCASRPGAEVVPAAVTGRATVYEWRCTPEGTPEIARQVFAPDARGFLADFWHEIPRP